MGTLEGYHCEVEVMNALKLDCDIIDPKKAQIEEAVKVLLQALGEDINREGIIKTPHRVAKAFLDGTRGYEEKVEDIVQGALFPEAGLDDNKVGQAGGVGGLVIVRDLDLFSLCESCLLPFHVKCHVGYVPSGQRVVGLSKLSRVANVFAKRLQDPQRLADEICSALQRTINPTGVAVLLQCYHIHHPTAESWSLGTTSEGFMKVLVSSGSGVFGDGSVDNWSEFFSLLKYREAVANKIRTRNSYSNYWCPSLANAIPPVVETISSDMVNAVNSMIRSLGEDPSKKVLAGTPARYAKWLMNFQNCDIRTKLNGFVSNKLDIPKSDVETKSDRQIYSELNLTFLSQCEHHLLPFHGVVHIGYFNAQGANPINKSLLQSIVHFYGFKLQVQERFTRQIAEIVAPMVGGDIMVVAEASHTCMISRGIEKFGSSTATVAVLGRFTTDAGARTSFLESLPSKTSL